MAVIAELPPVTHSESGGEEPALAPNQRIYKPLPKRSRLSSDSARVDGESLPTWAHGIAAQGLDDDLHPALDTATNSTENDIEGPPTPPQTSVDPLNYSSIFSSVHHLVKDAAAATTLFGAAASEIGNVEPVILPPITNAPDKGSLEDDETLGPFAQLSATSERRAPTPGQYARLAAAAASLTSQPDLRERAIEADEYRNDERDRDDDYGPRRGGANKKKRKVPSAANGHAFATSPPPSPPLQPAPASVIGVGGLSREKETTGMRANFATAMLKDLPKAMGALATEARPAPHERIPHSSYKRRREGLKPRALKHKGPVSTAPPPTARIKNKKAIKALPAPAEAVEFRLPNLYDPSIGTTISPPDEHLDLGTSLRFHMPESEFTFESTAPKVIALRVIELERECVKLKRARELILERARELEAVRQRALDDESKTKKLLPKGTMASGKTFADLAVQTDGPEGGQEMWVTPRTAPAPSNAPKKPPPRKGKKKRSAHANANNVHHRDNYVPSRPVRATTVRESLSTAVPLLRPGASLDLVDPNSPFYAPGADAHPQLGISMLAPFFASAEEWLCSFCESRILYGTSTNVSEAVRKRKGVLKVRKRAQERAAKAASGQSVKSMLPKPRGKLARATPTHDVACGLGSDGEVTVTQSVEPL